MTFWCGTIDQSIAGNPFAALVSSRKDAKSLGVTDRS
jgi:hypothetical protein